MVNDHTRSAENWKFVWYLLRLYIYIRVYVDSHSLGQLALASKRTASLVKMILRKRALKVSQVSKHINIINIHCTKLKFSMPIERSV